MLDSLSQKPKLLHQPDPIGFLPQFRQFAVMKLPDVNRAKIERLSGG
jgi:hypothetical protein